jgi:hypothetical protein
MAYLGQTINANEIAERNDFSPVPSGSYRVTIIGSEMKKTSRGDGEYLALEMDILDGDHAGRKIFERLNIVNQNQQTVDIAYRTLGEIIRACGKVQVADSEELHGINMLADVIVKPGKPYTKDGQTVQGNPQNEVKKYSPASGAGVAVAGNQNQQSAPATAAKKAPWQK